MSFFTNDFGVSAQHALRIYCTQHALNEYDKWVSGPMKSIFENGAGPSVNSVMRAYQHGLLGSAFPLRPFFIQVFSDKHDEAFTVTVEPNNPQWFAKVVQRVSEITGVNNVALSTEEGEVSPTDIAFVLNNRDKVFKVTEAAPIQQTVDARVTNNITASMSLDEQMIAYAQALAARIFKQNKSRDQQLKNAKKFTSKRASYTLAHKVAQVEGLDELLRLRYASKRKEVYNAVADVIRSNAATAIIALKQTNVPAVSLRQKFVSEFKTHKFGPWMTIGSHLEISSDEETSGDDSDIGENIDCEYAHMNMSSDDDELIEASFTKAVKNVKNKSKYVQFKLVRTAQDGKPQNFSWIGRTVLEPGDVIQTVVLPAKVEKQRRFSIKKKAPKPPPESIVFDYQSTSALSTESNWKTVFTFEMLLPKTGVAEGPSFAVPLDNHKYRAVISARRTGTGSGMVEEEGLHEFTVNPSGTKEARVRNYPITWEQVDNARRNQSLRSAYNIPEFVFHGRLINTPPYPRLLRVNGDIIDYFLPDQSQCIEDERYRTLEGYKENPAEFIKTVNDNVNYKAFVIVEVRRVIYEQGRNGNYVSAELEHAIAYDEEYTNAKVKSPDDCSVGVQYVYDYGPQEMTRRIDRKEAHRFAVDPALSFKGNVNVPVPTNIPTSPAMRLSPAQLRTFGATSSTSYGAYSDDETEGGWKENPDPFGSFEEQESDFGGFEKERTRDDDSRALALQQRADEIQNFEDHAKDLSEQSGLLEVLYENYRERISIDEEAKTRLNTMLSEINNSRRNAENAINAFRVSIITGVEDVRKTLVDFSTNVALFARSLIQIFNAALETQLSLYRANVRFGSLSASDKDQIVALIAANMAELRELGENIDTTPPATAARIYDGVLNTLNEIAAKLIASARGSDGAATSGNVEPLSPVVSSESEASVPVAITSSIVDDFYANLYNDSAPIGDDIVEKAEEVVSSVTKSATDAVTDAVSFTVLSANALAHSFDGIMHAAVSTMSPRYFPEIFEPGKNYITIIPDLMVWNRIANDIRLGKTQTQTFIRNHTFVVPSELFSHSRKFTLTSIGKPSNSIIVTRTYDKNERFTIIRVKSINGVRVKLFGVLDTHMTTPTLVQSVKLPGWRDF